MHRYVYEFSTTVQHLLLRIMLYCGAMGGTDHSSSSTERYEVRTWYLEVLRSNTLSSLFVTKGANLGGAKQGKSRHVHVACIFGRSGT